MLIGGYIADGKNNIFKILYIVKVPRYLAHLPTFHATVGMAFAHIETLC